MAGRSVARSWLKIRKMSVAQAENSFQSSLGRAEELADDGDRVGLADVGHEFAATLAGDGVDQPGDDLTHEGTEPVRRRRCEGRCHQATKTCVLVALHGQDRPTAVLHVRTGLDPGHLGDQRQRRMETAVPQDGDRVAVVREQEADGGAGQPVLGPGLADEGQDVGTLQARDLELG